jgi:hypothetical protein
MVMETDASGVGHIFAGLAGVLLLDNERVRVQKLVVGAGQSTGRPVHTGDSLQVFIKGGVLTSDATGRATLWKDGRVVWCGSPEPMEAGSTNTGHAPIEMVWVTLKPSVAPASPGAPASGPKYAYLNYPQIPGEDLLENDWVIVQRFLVGPGQWEGVHAHHPDMLYIHVKGGLWGARSYNEPEHAYDEPMGDGDVGWMPTIELSEGHESGNVGTEPIDLIWVTLKK